MIEVKNNPKERIEKQGLALETVKRLNKKTKANTYSGYLLSCIKKLRDDGNLDEAKLTEEDLGDKE